MFFSVILVNAPLVLNRDDRSPRFRRQTVKVEVRTGAIVKIPEFYSVGGVRFKNNIFRVLRVPFDYHAHSLRKQFYPNQWYRWKAETLKVCILLVWRVCDQAFGRCP